MKSKGHPTYEEEWKEAFAHAEVVPASSLWTSIDLQLSNDESGQMKKRVVYYQRMAAAAVIFAVGLAYTFWDVSSARSVLVMALLVSMGAAWQSHDNSERRAQNRKLIEEQLRRRIPWLAPYSDGSLKTR